MRGPTLKEVQDRLQRELASRDGNVRQLARDAARGGFPSIETARRAIYRILREGQEPNAETSRRFELGLRKKAGYFSVAQTPRKARRDRLAELEDEVERMLPILEELAARVEALERRAAPAQRGRGRTPAA